MEKMEISLKIKMLKYFVSYKVQYVSLSSSYKELEKDYAN